MSSNPYIDKLEQLLRSNLDVVSLQIIDDSASHKGHAGSHDNGNSHFTVKITARDFNGISKIHQHRMIYAILQQELQHQIHALAIQSSAV